MQQQAVYGIYGQLIAFAKQPMCEVTLITSLKLMYNSDTRLPYMYVCIFNCKSMYMYMQGYVYFMILQFMYNVHVQCTLYTLFYVQLQHRACYPPVALYKYYYNPSLCNPDQFSHPLSHLSPSLSLFSLPPSPLSLSLTPSPSLYRTSPSPSLLPPHPSLARSEAIKVGLELQRRHFIHHVTYDHMFKDERLFFRLLGDGHCSALNAKLSYACVPRPGIYSTLYACVNTSSRIQDHFTLQYFFFC